MDDPSASLLELGRALRASGYRFTTVTPETHRRVNERALAVDGGRARTLRDVFGWSRPFARDLLPRALLDLLRAAGAAVEEGELLRATVRFSSLGAHLFAHSAYPTVEADAVFFGPDSYRFCALLARRDGAPGRLVDVGCGSGAGGLLSGARRVVLADINERALGLARVNAALAGVEAEVVASDVLAGVAGEFDRIISNPPYLRDGAGRAYRDGGGSYGEGIAVRIVRESLGRLAPGGSLVVYTGAAIVDGEDTFLRHVAPLCREADAPFTYEELDPDVFGEELDGAAYAEVERIAVVALTAWRRPARY
jgi:release factor glutamine methyltransferase